MRLALQTGKVAVKSVPLQRIYKDRSGEFQNTSSFGPSDIPKAMLAVSKTYEYLVLDNSAKLAGALNLGSQTGNCVRIAASMPDLNNLTAIVCSSCSCRHSSV